MTGGCLATPCAGPAWDRSGTLARREAGSQECRNRQTRHGQKQDRGVRRLHLIEKIGEKATQPEGQEHPGDKTGKGQAQAQAHHEAQDVPGFRPQGHAQADLPPALLHR